MGMIDLVYKDFYDKESKIYDAGNVTREEFSIIKHVYKTRTCSKLYGTQSLVK